MRIGTDLTNKQFGRLLALCTTDKRDGSFVIWHCKCDCGNEVDVSSHNLLSGNTKSCGCILIENGEKVGADNFVKSKKKLFVYDTRLDMLTTDKKLNKNNKIGRTGVCKRKKDGKFVATITFRKKKYWLGAYATPEEAIQAREQAEKYYYGEFLEWYKENK